ncbi:MAG: HlyD family efflux transporter periplasmic adaptor subunit [Candidatus Cloacimonetes bacterium]|nr:HlyD family efflux transporter periplasmic adaptor subunit [Candidatus Cloacimonadota bacterium]
MDKKIEKKKWTIKKIIWFSFIGIFAFLVLYNLIFGDRSSKLNVQKERITIEKVKKGIFQDYISVTGTVLPIKTIYLDAIEGGRVEEILIESGTRVEEGNIILRLSNTNLHLSIMNREAGLAEQMNNLRNTHLSMEQTKLDLKKQLLEINFLLTKYERDYLNKKSLFEKDFISEEDFLTSKEQFVYFSNKKDLLIETQKQDSLFRNVQIEQLEESVNRMQENLQLVRMKLENLNVRASVSGQLAYVNAEVGEAIGQGQRLGQINVLDSYKIRADIDEHYISRVTTELLGEFEFSNTNYGLNVKKIFPEVNNGRFSIDLEFNENFPENIRIGQTFRVKLELGESKECTLIPRGGFYQATGGQWIFVVDRTEETAVKKDIRLGRQNPKYYEVLEGLNPGDKVIISNYDNYERIDKLVLKD